MAGSARVVPGQVLEAEGGRCGLAAPPSLAGEERPTWQPLRRHVLGVSCSCPPSLPEPLVMDEA